ncbi:cilia- and flagella-associated protein 184 [Genypterus blacodes]|uniref:cilia- and flagella-associated protein 184 n=1 Tax=Genypterus blacodes TaxID=154954 RepID=UPI003F75ADB7
MDVQPDPDEDELKNDIQRVSADSFNGEGRAQVTVANDENEDVMSPVVQPVEFSEPMKEEALEEALVEEEQPGEDHQDEAPYGNDVTTTEVLEAGEMNALFEQLLADEEGIVSEVKHNDDGLLSLDPETSEVETSDVLEEAEDEKEEATAATAPPDKDDDYEEQLKLLHQLYEEKEEARQQSMQLHMRLMEHFRKKAGVLAERNIPVSDQEYNNYISILTVLKQRLSTHSETNRQQAEELRVQTEDKLEQVENEWRAFMALKQEVAVTVPHMVKEAAQAKVESILASEQLRQEELIQLRLKHIKLKMKISKFKSELQAMEDQSSDPHSKLEVQATYSLEGRRKNEKRCELSVKVHKEMMGTRQFLPNVKEKLDWTKMVVQTNRSQLAELEALTLRQRDVLTGIRQSCNRLHRDNLQLKDRCGLLGDRVLLLDFEDTVEDCDSLEDKMQSLECRKAEILQLGRWRKT